ncbi:MAG: NUDIX hydrolase [Planctomycetota bacterium]
MTRVCERRLIHKGAKFDFETVSFEGADGRIVRREVVRHPGAVTVLPVLDDGAGVVLIRNERFTLGTELWELPAGTLEAGEDPAACALRELEEEAGYQANAAEALGRFYTTPGMTDELMHAFVATGLTKTEQRLEQDERIRVETMPVQEALRMVDRGDMMDAKSMLTLLMASRRGLLGG